MLLETYLREWERENDIQCGYGRGSVSGSLIAYALGITQMDSLKFDLNFFR
jgi:DNA polymerase-3 subunit alpha